MILEVMKGRVDAIAWEGGLSMLKGWIVDLSWLYTVLVSYSLSSDHCTMLYSQTIIHVTWWYVKVGM